MATEVIRYVNTASSAGGNGTTPDPTGDNRAYPSLNAAEAALQRNLDTSDEQMTIYCLASTGVADTAPTAFVGWTQSDPTRFVKVQAYTGHEARSEWDASRYRLVCGGSSPDTPLEFITDAWKWVRVFGLQIEMGRDGRPSANWAQEGLRIAPQGNSQSGAVVYVAGNHFRVTGAAAVSITNGWQNLCSWIPDEIGASTTPIGYFYNNIFSHEGTGTFAVAPMDRPLVAEHRDLRAYIYNNTWRGAWPYCVRGDNNGSRLHYLRNNLFAGASAVCDGSYQTSRCDYNATDLAALGYTANTNDRLSQTFTFASSTDHALAASDAGAKDYGQTDPGSGLFSNDINGNTRSAPWDIGAAEYVATGSNGNASGLLTSITVGAATGTATGDANISGAGTTVTITPADGTAAGGADASGLAATITITALSGTALGTVVQRRWPQAILASVNLNGVVANIQDDPASPDGSWLLMS